jgi:GNAT superfamily N-acetyltransferase
MARASATVRKIRHSDKGEVLEISSKIWGGNDYLPHVFDEWFADPKSHLYGVEADDRIVAIGNMRLVDGGKIGWMEGLRVHPDYRKRGFANMLTYHFVDLGRKLNVERLRYSTGGNNRASLKLARKAGFNRLFKMSALWYEDLNTAPRSEFHHKRMIHAAPTEVFKLLKTNTFLLPHNILVFDWKAIDATLQGFKEVGKDHTFNVTKSRGKLTGFSLGYKRSDTENGSWSFTTYATDQDVFTAHFDSQIRQAIKLGITAATCTCPTQFEDMLKEYVPKFRWKLQLILLEKKMKP